LDDDYSGIDQDEPTGETSKAPGQRSLWFASAMLCIVLALVGLTMWLVYALTTAVAGFGSYL